MKPCMAVCKKILLDVLPILSDEEGMLPNMENVYGQYSYMDNAPTSSAHEKMSNTSRYKWIV